MGVADDQLVGKLESSCKAKLEEPPELPLTATIAATNDNGGHYSKKTARSSIEKTYKINVRQQSFVQVKKEKGTLQTTPLADLMSRAVDQVNELEIFPHSRPRLKRFRDNMAQNALINVLTGGPFDSIDESEMSESFKRFKVCSNPTCDAFTVWPSRKRKCCKDPRAQGGGCKQVLISVEEASVRVRKEAQEATRAAKTEEEKKQLIPLCFSIPMLMLTTNEPDDGEQDDPPPKRQRLTTVKHESEWYGSRTLVTDAEGNFAGYYNRPKIISTTQQSDRISIPEPMLHKTQSKESVKEWLEKTMDRLLRHGRRWMFVIGDGSTIMYIRSIMREHQTYASKIIPVLGLLHEDKINHEAAMDLLIRLLGLELSHALGWTSLKSVSVLADGVDTRKLQDHLSWATSALMYESTRALARPRVQEERVSTGANCNHPGIARAASKSPGF